MPRANRADYGREVPHLVQVIQIALVTEGVGSVARTDAARRSGREVPLRQGALVGAGLLAGAMLLALARQFTSRKRL